MSMDLTGIRNVNDYYSNHYLATIFEDNAKEVIKEWRAEAREEASPAPWSLLRRQSRDYHLMHERGLRLQPKQLLPDIRALAEKYLESLGYEKTESYPLPIPDSQNEVYIFSEVNKRNGAPWLWVLLSQQTEEDASTLKEFVFDSDSIDNGPPRFAPINNELLATQLFFSFKEPPRWLMIISQKSIVLLDRNKWNEKKFLEFELDTIFGRREETTFQIMNVLLHRESLCPDEGESLLDTFDSYSQRHASGVSQDLKYALRESIELLGNEVLYDMRTRQGLNLKLEFPDQDALAEELSIQCLRYMYRILFLLFIESRPELGYAPMKSQAYLKGYSLESLRDIEEVVREETSNVGEGFYFHETLDQLFWLIYDGYPVDEETYERLNEAPSHHNVFLVEPLKAHVFDTERTQLITEAKLRNSVLLRIIHLMSNSAATGRGNRRNQRRGRISYASLGINQLGAVYEALLSYRGFIAKENLYEVKRAQDSFDELDVGYCYVVTLCQETLLFGYWVLSLFFQVLSFKNIFKGFDCTVPALATLLYADLVLPYRRSMVRREPYSLCARITLTVCQQSNARKWLRPDRPSKPLKILSVDLLLILLFLRSLLKDCLSLRLLFPCDSSSSPR